MKKGKEKIEKYGQRVQQLLAELRLKDAEEFRKYLRMNTESFEVLEFTYVIMLLIIALYTFFFISISKIRLNLGDA